MKNSPPTGRPAGLPGLAANPQANEAVASRATRRGAGGNLRQVSASFMPGFLTLVLSFVASAGLAAEKKAPEVFRWVNKLPENRAAGLRHGTFFSRTNQTEVGYYIHLPPGYDDPANAMKRYPVVYYLHGGRPGGEHKSISLMRAIRPAMEAGRVPPMIYVFVNGGAMSHYNFPALKSYGETALVKELIPHIDATHRTIAQREGRGLEGFSQGGRGTGRIIFKFPELFSSCAPMGGGHQHEKHAAENGGRETGGTQFEPGNNTWDLARDYAAKRMKEFPLRILIADGRKDFNYAANVEWSAHLKSLGIPHEFRTAGDAEHSAAQCYEALGDAVMLFHAENFRRAGVIE
jgi:enterochelin esterase-like enzyme